MAIKSGTDCERAIKSREREKGGVDFFARLDDKYTQDDRERQNNARPAIEIQQERFAASTADALGRPSSSAQFSVVFNTTADAAAARAAHVATSFCEDDEFACAPQMHHSLK